MVIHLQLTPVNQDITQLTFNQPKYSQLLMFCFYFFHAWRTTSMSKLLLIIFKQTKNLLLPKLDYLVSYKQTPPPPQIPNSSSYHQTKFHPTKLPL